MRHNNTISNERRAERKRIVTLISSGLFAILSAVVLMNNTEPSRLAIAARDLQSTNKKEAGNKPSRIFLSSKASANGTTSAAAAIPPGAVTITAADVSALSLKNLMIPVAGVSSGQLHDSFYDSRSEGRVHKALDIMAPRDTPVLAADDGRVLKLHQSGRGGTMLYQSDVSGVYVYFYGHLTRYADGISEGKAVRRGEVIAFVGDTGNAGAGNCHLHFGISKMTEPGRWSGGEPINPFAILTANPGMQSIGAGR